MHSTQGKPERLRAKLPSAGHRGTIKWTPHVYDRSEVKGGTLFHFFRCEETGAVRIWGCEAVPFHMETN
jgi:hypothetical protein